jgi:hypothetical protein
LKSKVNKTFKNQKKPNNLLTIYKIKVEIYLLLVPPNPDVVLEVEVEGAELLELPDGELLEK